MLGLIVILIFAVFVFIYLKKRRTKEQAKFIDNYRFSKFLIERIKKEHSYLSDADLVQMQIAFKDYFYICREAKGNMVAMPSRAVDIFWHEFILYTHEYQVFCQEALGRFLHHTPTEGMQDKTKASESLKRVWRLSCLHEGITPEYPTSLPLLFGIDMLLDIPNGSKYHLQSDEVKGDYNVNDIGCVSNCVGLGDDGMLKNKGSYSNDYFKMDLDLYDTGCSSFSSCSSCVGD